MFLELWFVEYFRATTPETESEQMNGSRPSKRKADDGIESLHAIPWIFAWTQTRFHLPVWLGFGVVGARRPRNIDLFEIDGVGMAWAEDAAA